MRLSPPQSRLRSLDVYRGITIAAMILVNDPGAVEDTYPALLHAPWTGWTFADTIFPAFLWIIGVSITLSTAARLARGQDRGTLLRHGLQRSALLFLIGIVLSDLTFPVRTFPYFGVRALPAANRCAAEDRGLLSRGDGNFSVDELARRYRLDRRPERGLRRADVPVHRPELQRRSLDGRLQLRRIHRPCAAERASLARTTPSKTRTGSAASSRRSQACCSACWRVTS